MKINETALAVLGNYHSFCAQNEVVYGNIGMDDSKYDYPIITIELDDFKLDIHVLPQVQYEIFEGEEKIVEGHADYMSALMGAFEKIHSGMSSIWFRVA